MESGSASCAAGFGSNNRGRGRGQSRARIRAACAHRCYPLSTFVVCAPRVLVGCCCCYSGARIDERARPDAAARCSTSVCITQSAWHHQVLRQIDALPRFRGAHGGIGAPRWLPRALCGLLRPAEHELFALGGGRALGIDVPGCRGRLGRVARSSGARYSTVMARA